MAITYVYIRHAAKEYNNGHAPPGKPQHDPSISRSSFRQCQEVGTKLVQDFNSPSMVITSPYLRTRQTASKLSYAIPSDLEDENRQLFIDTNIAEYLGNQHGEIDIEDDTYRYSLKENSTGEEEFPLKTRETKLELNERIMRHLLMMQILHDKEKEATQISPEVHKTVWVITHGLVIATIYNILKECHFSGCEAEEFYPAELGGIAVTIKEGLASVTLLYPSSRKKSIDLFYPVYGFQFDQSNTY
jgi:broad specificity phosphatase PhoE